MEASNELVQTDDPGQSSKQMSEPKSATPIVVQDNGVSPLVQMFASGQYSIDQIEKFIELQERHDANLAKKAYFDAISHARAELPTIAKDGRNSHLGSNYATLDAMIAGAGPALAKYQLSFTFKYDQNDDGYVTTRCIGSHALGHTDYAQVRLPIMEPIRGAKGAATNPAQMVGVAMTYGRRYSFAALFGIATGDDNDGNHPAPDERDLPPIISDKQASQIEDLLIKLEDLEAGFRARWKKHYGSSWPDSDTPPGLEIPVDNFPAVLKELQTRLKKYESATEDQSE